jgi:hypothetical protein
MDPANNPDPSACNICSQLAARETTSQKYGWDENDTSLPDIVSKLVMGMDLQPDSDRARQLWHCPECDNYYLYESGYEYLVNGSEDWQMLTRLTPQEAREILGGLLDETKTSMETDQ